MILTAVLLAGLPDTSALSAQSTQTPTPAASAPTQSVTVDRGVLTVDVRDMPLDEVLKTISEQSGVNITVHVAMDRFGYTKLQLRALKDMDLLYPNTTYIHSSHLLPDEWQMVADSGGIGG